MLIYFVIISIFIVYEYSIFVLSVIFIIGIVFSNSSIAIYFIEDWKDRYIFWFVIVIVQVD